MSKIVIFLEGETEYDLTINLLKNIARGIGLEITKTSIEGGGRTTELSLKSYILNMNGDPIHFIQIFICNSDNQVNNRIKQSYLKLKSKGFDKVIGLRDVKGKFSHNDIPVLEREKYLGITNDDNFVSIIYSILETEAWFIAEFSHFSRIDKRLTPQFISAHLGCDFKNQNTSLLQDPADLLNSIYSLAGIRYDKTKKRRRRTIKNLDWNIMMNNVRIRNNDFNSFCFEIEQFIN